MGPVLPQSAGIGPYSPMSPHSLHPTGAQFQLGRGCRGPWGLIPAHSSWVEVAQGPRAQLELAFGDPTPFPPSPGPHALGLGPAWPYMLDLAHGLEPRGLDGTVPGLDLPYRGHPNYLFLVFKRDELNLENLDADFSYF